MLGFARPELLKVYLCSHCLMKHPHSIALVSNKPALFQAPNLYWCVHPCHFYVRGFCFAEHWRSWTEGTGIPPQNIHCKWFFSVNLVSHAGIAKYCHFKVIPQKMKVTLPIAATPIVTNANILLCWQWFNDGQGEAEELTCENFCRDFSLSNVIQRAVTSRFSQIARMGSGADLAVKLRT